MSIIQGASRAVHPHHSHVPSAHAREMLRAMKGTFPTTILDQKLASEVEKMKPHAEAHETAKGGSVKLVYHFKSPAEAKAVYESSTSEYQGKRYPSPSLGDNIAEGLDTVDEVGDPSITLHGSNLILSVGFKVSQ